MSYSVPKIEGEAEPTYERDATSAWPLWEVFVRQHRGLNHVQAGSLHAPDPETALQSARDVYVRRTEGVSIWVVPSGQITASDPDDSDSLFEAIGKPYRNALYYEIPEEVGQM